MKMTLERTVLSCSEIRAMVKRVADELRQELADIEEPVFVGVMKGAYIWMADLLRELAPDIDLTTDYIDVSSYVGTQSTGHLTIVRDVKTDLKNRTVVILDEVVDSGLTLRYLKSDFEQRGAKKVYVAVAVDKRPDKSVGGIVPDFTGADVPNEFLVGYGMDFDGHFRNLPEISVLSVGK